MVGSRIHQSSTNLQGGSDEFEECVFARNVVIAPHLIGVISARPRAFRTRSTPLSGRAKCGTGFSMLRGEKPKKHRRHAAPPAAAAPAPGWRSPPFDRRSVKDPLAGSRRRTDQAANCRSARQPEANPVPLKNGKKTGCDVLHKENPRHRHRGQARPPVPLSLGCAQGRREPPSTKLKYDARAAI